VGPGINLGGKTSPLPGLRKKSLPQLPPHPIHWQDPCPGSRGGRGEGADILGDNLQSINKNWGGGGEWKIRQFNVRATPLVYGENRKY